MYLPFSVCQKPYNLFFVLSNAVVKFRSTPSSLSSLKLVFERSKSGSLRGVSVTRIDNTLSYGFPQTVLSSPFFQWFPVMILLSHANRFVYVHPKIDIVSTSSFVFLKNIVNKFVCRTAQACTGFPWFCMGFRLHGICRLATNLSNFSKPGLYEFNRLITDDTASLLWASTIRDHSRSSWALDSKRILLQIFDS